MTAGNRRPALRERAAPRGERKEPVKTLHLIEATYLCPTDTQGARFRLQSLSFDICKTYPMRGELNGLLENAETTLDALGYTVLGVGETPRGYIYAVKEFCPEPFAQKEHTHSEIPGIPTWECGRGAPYTKKVGA